MIELRSKRLLLRELTSDDVTERYASWLRDPDVNQFLETRFEEQTLEKIRAYVCDQKQRTDSFLLGIFALDGIRHIGNIKLGPINPHHSSAHISFLIGDRQSWARGFASEAVRVVTDWGFNTLGLERIEAGCYEKNLGSLRVLLNCGYEVEGFFRKARIARDGSRTGSFWLGRLSS